MIDDLPLAPAVPLFTDLYLRFDDEQAAHDAFQIANSTTAPPAPYNGP